MSVRFKLLGVTNMTIYMKSKEEIFKWHTHNLSAFSLATYKKPVYDAMQEYADQECAAKDCIKP